MKLMGLSLPVWLMNIHITEQYYYRTVSGVSSLLQSLVLTPHHREKKEA